MNCPHMKESKSVPNLSVRRLDWKNPMIKLQASTDDTPEQGFLWNVKDFDLLKKISMIVAADGMCLDNYYCLYCWCSS